MVTIITRAEWGARPPRNPPRAISIPTQMLWLHHTASPSGYSERIRAIQTFHMDERGWNDIAYSFLINHDGMIYEGRGAGIAGGHTAGTNTVSHAICLLGHFDQTQPTTNSISSTVALARYGFEQGWWPDQFTGGHRDAPGANTSCPGQNLYSQLTQINQAIIEGDNIMWTKDLTEQGWRELAKAGIASGGEAAVVDYWWTKRAERTDTEHQSASQSMSAAIAVRVATGVGTVGPPGPPGPPGTLTIRGDVTLP